MNIAASTTRTVVMEREMRHPPEKIWRALTQGPLIEDWLMSNDFQPVVGHRFRFRAQAMPPHWDGIVHSEVQRVEPHTTLAYSWDTTGPDNSPGLRTTVTWTLSPTAAGTLVRMEQSGFSPDQENNFRGATYGWQRNLATLESVVDKLD